MRKFEYYLFENFDAEKESKKPCNPRGFLGKGTDDVLSFIADRPTNTCALTDCRDRFGAELIEKLISGGVLRRDGGTLTFDCPVFLREDASSLRKAAAGKASGLADILQSGMDKIRTCCAGIRNGFSVEHNLYHILCGMVFDGRFFDCLSGKGAVAVSRVHPSGLDYLTVIYETCDELQPLSRDLLCSYNRLANDQCALESFGDAGGNRLDFYRLFRLAEREVVPNEFRDARAELYSAYDGANKDALLRDAVSLALTGTCAPATASLMERFGYTQNGRVCVPVYTPEHQKVVLEIEAVVEGLLGDAMAAALTELASGTDMTAVRHGVNRLETANELYHILFGLINEELVSRGLVAAPAFRPGEGRYMKCIELYG